MNIVCRLFSELILTDLWDNYLSILNYRYAYDNIKGLMASRSESVANRSEIYTYDNLDRLIGMTFGNIGEEETVQTFAYSGNGNIENKSNVGNYFYDNNKPHAVTNIEPINKHIISTDACTVTYNFFNQPTQIKEGRYQLDLFYDANQQRYKAVDAYLNSTHYYINKYYEKEVYNATRHYHYIYGDK